MSVIAALQAPAPIVLPVEFRLSEKQRSALAILKGPATHCLLYGGSRSGKTFLLTRAIIIRALAAPGSRHAILRFRFSHCRASMMMDTFPKVLDLCFPGCRLKTNQTDSYAQFSNGSQVWFGGLDDKDRVEKILGNEYATIYLNECSQIPYPSRLTAVTRLAQRVDHEIGGAKRPLRLKMFYDCNPPTRSHWTYQLWVKGVDPLERAKPINRVDFACAAINPIDNLENLPDSYLDTLKGLPARLRLRFLEGQFSDDTAGMLWTAEGIEGFRVLDSKLPDMQRKVVGVDPSGSRDFDNLGNDEIGIVVCGLGTDGNGYVLEDVSCKVGPATWGKIAGMAYERHKADVVVGEENYGGAMVEHTIRTYNSSIPYRRVIATRNKVVRAEPIAALAEQGRIRHAGQFRNLEDELCAMTTAGYIDTGSPNRVDAYVWAFTELFGEIVAPKPDRYIPPPPRNWRVA